MNDDIAIRVDGVYKKFHLPHEKNNSLKSLLVAAGKKKNKSYEVQQALKDISFEVKKGEFFGIVGRNGSGKSTLLKIIAEIYQPTKGNLQRNGKLVPFIELGVGFNPELTGRENVYLNGALLGFSTKEIDVMYDDIVRFAELERFMDQKLKNYSSGMQVRLAFSVATRAKADILLIDEVLAVGDSAFQKKCYSYFRKLKDAKKTVIFVSHDMSAVQEYCDRAVLIENSELVLAGTPGNVATAYTRMFAEEEAGKKKDLKKKKERWGSGHVKYESVHLSPKIATKQDTVKLNVKAKCLKEITGEVILGFKVRDAEGKPLMGTNTKIKKLTIKPKLHEEIELEWDIPVIFCDGNYYIDVVIEADNYASTYDYWEEALHLMIERNEPSSYLINPIINTRVSNAKE